MIVFMYILRNINEIIFRSIVYTSFISYYMTLYSKKDLFYLIC